MGILEEAAALARERLGKEADDLTVDRLVVGLFFTGVKLSNGVAGVCFTPVKEIPEAVCCQNLRSRARSWDKGAWSLERAEFHGTDQDCGCDRDS